MSKSVRKNLKVLFNYANCSFAIQIKSPYGRTTQFFFEMHEVLQEICKQRLDKKTKACKTFTKLIIQEKTYNLEFS